MKSSRNMTIAFLLNFSFAIIEFIFGLLFHSSAVLADAIHDTGDALAIGLSTFFEKISTRKEDRNYTLGYKRYSLLGALLTSVILLVGSTLVIVENVPKLLAPEKVNYDGMLVLGIVAIAVNTAASRVVSHGHSHNESILSLHFLEDILGWLAVILVSLILRFTDWYFLDPLLSLVIAGFILSKAMPKFWENIRIFLDHVPSDVDLSQLYQEIAVLENVRAITQLNVWTTDGLEKYAMLHICLENPNLLAETQIVLRQKLLAYGIAKVTIQTDESLQEHQEYCIGKE
ncbi:cation diffusion facilitator family transporter [Streptococcus cristatus ATCC 51100]|uniref:Cation diffusion facilitator family transporter n=1 Tax=Streptococcus cristatus ATCC 51100 TaxID=889201 RepID=A0AAV3EGE3_STRCR|nr:cation diffusion facilitator family transporter [Streptococcus cristatus]EFX52347.1 cation diffusion facilitator family transporter [Streptococcus cristatus ATCC 51100]EGU68501.1 cation diffusion facilitator family transporter [Streptococcus cristatus ATCC 51100]KJQ60448.1 cation efflux system protein [Streptococcus cristatus]MCG7329440.1 cation diffusion facilitator family transporter [Streptococcus cristatus]SQG33234.1 cation (Co/Zn/Cd) efflux protein [Streptococcus cristatus ATCC 51100]